MYKYALCEFCCSIGPMVYGICYSSLNNKDELKKMGFAGWYLMLRCITLHVFLQAVYHTIILLILGGCLLPNCIRVLSLSDI